MIYFITVTYLYCRVGVALMLLAKGFSDIFVLHGLCSINLANVL